MHLFTQYIFSRPSNSIPRKVQEALIWQIFLLIFHYEYYTYLEVYLLQFIK